MTDEPGRGSSGSHLPVDIPRILQEIGSVVAVSLLGQVCGLLTVFFLGRNLSRENFGHFMLFLYAQNLLGASCLLGFQNALLRRWPRESLAQAHWPDLLSGLGRVALGTGLVLSVLFVLLYRAAPIEGLLLFLAGTSVGFSFLSATLLQIFRRFVLGQWLYTLWRPGLLVAVAALLLLQALGLPALLASLAGLGLLQATLGVLFLRRLPRGTAPISLRAMLPDAAAFTGLHLAAVLAARLDSFSMPRLLDLDALGLYSAVGVWSLTGYQVASLGLGQVLNPRLASSEPVPTRKLVAVILAAGGGAILVLVLLANHVLPLVFGPQYAGDHRALAALLAVTGLLQTLYVLPSSRIGILASRRRLYSFMGLSVASIAVGLTLLLVLVPRFGLIGAATASAITWAWRTGTAWLTARRPVDDSDGS